MLLDAPQVQSCACANLRSATRLVTQFYDSYLQPSGLQTSQYSLLVRLARAGAISVTQFAQNLSMDRTTLTRNLEPLIRQGLVARASGQDQRVRMIEITPRGCELVAIARPLWAQAQERMIAGLGAERLQALLDELAAVSELVQSMP
jgi:DNA-binding MarR family transcriptional regulator